MGNRFPSLTSIVDDYKTFFSSSILLHHWVVRRVRVRVRGRRDGSRFSSPSSSFIGRAHRTQYLHRTRRTLLSYAHAVRYQYAHNGIVMKCIILLLLLLLSSGRTAVPSGARACEPGTKNGLTPIDPGRHLLISVSVHTQSDVRQSVSHLGTPSETISMCPFVGPPPFLASTVLPPRRRTGHPREPPADRFPKPRVHV